MKIRLNLLCCIACASLCCIPPAHSQTINYEFQEGCCLNTQAFPRPSRASKAAVADVTILKSLNCATSSWLVADSKSVAKYWGTGSELLVAYYYGKYMPEQAGPTLTIGVYSRDGQRGMLFDIAYEGDDFSVVNIPAVRKSGNRWRVGEINGGVWSYTRLYHLAQEIGGRTRRAIRVDSIDSQGPAGCWVMNEKIR